MASDENKPATVIVLPDAGKGRGGAQVASPPPLRPGLRTYLLAVALWGVYAEQVLVHQRQDMEDAEFTALDVAARTSELVEDDGDLVVSDAGWQILPLLPE